MKYEFQKAKFDYETFYKIQIVSFYFDMFNTFKDERKKSYL